MTELTRPPPTQLAVVGGLSLGLLGLVVLSASSGAVQIPVSTVFQVLLGPLGELLGAEPDRTHALVLRSVRLPRIAMGVLVGGGLAMAGAQLQGLFRNPLADPGLIGVSSGASLAAAAVIVLGLGTGSWLGAASWLGALVLPVAAFLGALSATALVLGLATRDGHTEVSTLLLAGIAISALAAAGVGLLITISDDNALRSLTFWTLGSLGGATWPGVAVVAVGVGIPSVLGLRKTESMNALQLGEAEAGHLGVDVQRLKASVALGAALMVGVSVAFTGIIGFVGLVVPHLCRLALGPDHRRLLPTSLVAGACLLVLADLLCRTLLAPVEVPIGVLTTLVGGPFFVWLLLRRRASLGFLP